MNDFTRGYMRGYKDAQKEALMSQSDGAQPAVAEQHKQEPVAMEGWKLVPIKPTMKMIDALADTNQEHESVWDAVLAVAPAPPQRTWVGLTDTEKYALADDVARRGVPVFEAICEAEAKLKEKNT